jgi:hypothetical protein
MGIADILNGVVARAGAQELFPFDPTTQIGVIADGTIRWVEPGSTETLGLPCAIGVSNWETILAAEPAQQAPLVMTGVNFGLEVRMPDALAYIGSYVLP